MSHQRFIILDWETRSRADLFLVGAYEYAVDPSTEILCAAWKYGTFRELAAGVETESWSPFLDTTPPKRMLSALCDPGVFIVAHNAGFERVIIRHVLSRLYPKLNLERIPVERFVCTASFARALALPASLEKCAGAMRLPVQKDMEGRKAMLTLSKPMNESGEFNQSLELLKTVIKYCVTDIEAQTGLFLKLAPLSPAERAVWILDQKINDRGFLVDRELVRGALSLIEAQEIELRAELTRLTEGKVEAATKRDQLLRHLNDLGAGLIDLTKKSVADKLADPTTAPLVKAILEVRQRGSKSSTAKYKAFEARSRSDGRSRENLIYHGASTGRFSGAGVQVQNFPRGTIKMTPDILRAIARGETPNGVKLSDALPSAIRSAILPDAGYELFCGDYAGIEARQVFWLAGHEDGLKLFRSGADIYRLMASDIYGKTADVIDPTERFLGKSAILGSGYGMGASKFQATCEAQGVIISPELAKRAIDTYRSVHAPVVQLWRNVENAAIAAVRFPGKIFETNHCKFYVQGDFLFIELPSSRRLAYNRPKVKREPTPWGQEKFVLYHMAVDQRPGAPWGWVETGTYGGRLTENICQAVSRDIMVEAMLRLESAGYEILITVHDEIVAQRKTGLGSVAEFEKLMSECPAWAAGSAIKVEAWSGPRYKKG